MKSGPIFVALKTKKWRNAVRLLTPFAKENPDIAYLIGLIYWDFTNTFEGSEKSLEWFRLAAKSDHLEAKVCLARQYRKGYGVGKKLALARRLYEECAVAGSCEAMSYLSEMYFDGQGGAVDGKKAVDLLIEVANDAKGGHRLKTHNLCDYDSLADYHLAGERDVIAVAQAYLGTLAMDGVAFFPRNYVNATYWLEKAFENGVTESGEMLANLYLKRSDPLSARAILDKLPIKKNRRSWYSLAQLLESVPDIKLDEVKLAYERADEAGHLKAIKGLAAYEKSLRDKAKEKRRAEEEWQREQMELRYRYLDPLGNFSSYLAPERAEDQFLAADRLNLDSDDSWTLKLAARGYMASFHNGFEDAAKGIERILQMIGPDRFRQLMVPDA